MSAPPARGRVSAPGTAEPPADPAARRPRGRLAAGPPPLPAASLLCVSCRLVSPRPCSLRDLLRKCLQRRLSARYHARGAGRSSVSSQGRPRPPRRRRPRPEGLRRGPRLRAASPGPAARASRPPSRACHTGSVSGCATREASSRLPQGGRDC